MTYAIHLTPAARRAIERTLPPSVAPAVWEFIYGPLAENPHRVGKPLGDDLQGIFSARRGEYRVLYKILADRVVVDVVRVAHRRDAYRR